MRVVVTGATGFIGRMLCQRLVRDRHEVIAFTRDASRSRDELHPKVQVVSWARGAPKWESLVDGAGALVNLSGESIAQRWTARAKQRMVESRLAAADQLYHAVAAAKERPAVLVSPSAVGYYGPHGDEPLTEADGPGSDFLADVCVRWEGAARRFEELGLRVARLRIGVVLSPEGGALAKMLLPFRLFTGGPIGSGEQWLSWIHRDDLIDLFALALADQRVGEAVNATAPEPVRMRDFADTLGSVLHRRSWFPGALAAHGARAALGEGATVVLDGQRVLPKRAQELGFTFRYPQLRPALQDLLG